MGTIRQILIIFMVMAAILTFAGMFGFGIYQTWTAQRNTPPQYSEAFLYVATALTALVGGVVAVGFGQKPPPPQAEKMAQRMTRNLAGLGNLITFYQQINWRDFFSGMYAVVYVLWGLAAIIIWIFLTPQTPDLIKNLATTFLGLFLPIVAAFFKG